MLRRLPMVALLTVIFPALFLLFSQKHPVYSINGGVVINEIQISGDSSADEFIELYNPGPTAVLMTGWRLVKKTAAGNPSNLVSSLNGTIPAGGYFLVVQDGYDGIPYADAYYSTQNNLAVDNTVILYSDAGVTVIDKVGMGGASDIESTPAESPDDYQSIERIDGIDTNDNGADFSLSVSPSPENSGNPIPTPTPTAVASPTATPSPTDGVTPTPIPEPTATPIPSDPTPTAILTPTPIPTSTPTPLPTATPAPTALPTSTPTDAPPPTPTAVPSEPTPTPTDSTSPTPTPQVIRIFPGQLTCRIDYLSFRIFHLRFSIPRWVCTLR